ncbi:MAG: ABC transporter ATP-binding protein [Epsilonproteobacteria bacterium]|nr:MAG: ABC transporter ATP-binding protein [Campylobacterota bacterium]
MLKVDNLSVSHKKKIAIKNLSFEVNSGEVIGFIGADGAGKSSALNALAGVIKFDGEIIYGDFSYKTPKEAEKVKHDIGYMPQGIGLVLYDTLTIKEHLDFFTDIRDIKIDKEFLEYKEHLLSMAGLEKFLDRRAGDLSGGMMQKLSLVCTMLHRPKLLILDEPTTGVDPLSRIELWEILKQNAKEFNTISIISTAYMGEASKMDNILLFDEGEIIARGSSEKLIEEIKPFVYEKTQTDKTHISISETTYCLENLEAKNQTPTLESLFFVNALKKEKLLPKLQIAKSKESIDKNIVVMKASKITKKFGDFYANRDVDCELKSGEILGLLGANGAGKTTFIKMLLGLLPLDGGELELFDKKIKNSKDRNELKSQIGYVSQHFALYDDMTVRENMMFFASIHKIDTKKSIQLIDSYSKELGFENYLDEMPKSLPLGINQRFSLAVSILHEPKVLFLDEPTSGVDAIARAQFWELLEELKTNRGISILITTHYMSEAEFCDRVVLLKDGQKIADDTVENFYKKFPNAKSFEEIFLEYFR